MYYINKKSEDEKLIDMIIGFEIHTNLVKNHSISRIDLQNDTYSVIMQCEL